MRFVWLTLFFSAIVPPALADMPLPEEPYIATSASGRFFFTLLPGRWERGQFTREPFGAAYKLQADGGFLELWQVAGWYSFRFQCFLSDDGRYLVRLNSSPGGNKISKDDLAIAFYDRGKLLRQFSLGDLVKDESKVVASVSHYRWLAEPELGLPDKSAVDEVSFGDNKFGLTTIDGIVYSFDITSGKIIATATTPSLTAKGVAFEISKAGLAGDGSFAKYLKAAGESGAYLVGKSVSIRCVFRNNGPQPVTVWLKDHDPHSGTLPFPLDIQARVESGDGKVLTANGIDKQGWWTSIYLSSQINSYDLGDNITIPPGEELTRVVPLDEVLKGCDGLPKGLPAGNFIVQLRLFGPDLRLESNRLKIAVVDPE